MRQAVLATLFYVSGMFACTQSEGQAGSSSVLAADSIKARFISNSSQCLDLYNLDGVQRFYHNRDYESAWIKHRALNKNGQALFLNLSRAFIEGLSSLDYHGKAIDSLLIRTKSTNIPDAVAFDLEVLLTDAYLLYAKHLFQGKVCPEDVNQDWHVPCREEDFEYWSYLQQALEQNQIGESLKQLKPQYQAYEQLKQALVHYSSLSDSVDFRFKAKPLIQYSPVELLKLTHKLMSFKDLQSHEIDQDHDYMVAAINKFKLRHGLEPDGTLDAVTIRLLNEPISNKIATIRANLERWRWLPPALGSEYILINMANFQLTVVSRGHTVFRKPVIIGAPYHATPAFSAEMTHIILKPYWYVPQSIIRNEILTKINPHTYLRNNHYQLLNNDHTKVDLDSVDWTDLSSFTYQIRQKPGAFNALGLIKFVMPNPYSIYIHDTPSKNLFEEENRSFSHGCIRLKDPFQLANFLVNQEQGWTTDSLYTTAHLVDKPLRINLEKPWPVHVLYWTAWIDQNQQIHFRSDVYGRDKELIQALGPIH